MRQESRLGRVLWIGLLAILGGYVVANFARSPLLAPSGSAAVRPAQLTLWVPAGEAGGEAGIVAQEAAAALELEGHTAVVKSLPGGSSQAVADFLGRPSGEEGTGLLVVSATTLADLSHDRLDRLVPGAAEEAALAQALLRRALPVGALTRDPLTLAVAHDSKPTGDTQLLKSMRDAPWERIFGIADDTWSRDQLAALVNRAGVDGHVRFDVFASGAEAGQALETGAAKVALATRGDLREGVRDGRLIELGWPFAERPPSAWVALVARPGLPAERLARLRAWLHALAHDRRWIVHLESEGRAPDRSGGWRLKDLLRAASSRAGWLERLARRVESR